MYYSTIGCIAILLHLILNHEFFRNTYAKTEVNRAYYRFVWCVLAYYISDVLWSAIYHSPYKNLVYIDTIAYYIFMSLTVVLLCRYVTTYLDLNNTFGKFINGFGIFFCVAEVVLLIVNQFTHTFLWFDKETVYQSNNIRYIAYYIQILLCALLVMQTGLAVRDKTIAVKRSIRRRYKMIHLFCAEMIGAIAMQILLPIFPIYTIGLMIGMAIIHIFVKQDEKDDYRKELETSRDSLETIVAEQKEMLNIVSSLSKSYICTYYINLETGKFRELIPSTVDDVREIVGPEGDAREKFLEMSKHLVNPAYEKSSYEFTDLSTLAERLENRDTVEFVFLGIPEVGWCYGEFISAGRDKNGRCTHVLWVVRCIQEQRMADEKHKNDLMEQLSLVNTLSQGYLNVYVLDPNSKTVRILKLDGYVTEGISSEKKEYPYEALYRKYVEDRVYEPDEEKMLQVMEISNILNELKDAKEYIGTYRVMDNGEIHYYQYQFAKIVGSDSIIAGFQNVDVMIAAEKEHQESLQKALDQAENANAAKTIFLNNMSHDIRTPMNAILGFARLMKNNIDNADTLADYILKIEKSGEYLLSIINNVLDMARIESGKIELNEGVVDLGDEDMITVSLFNEDIIRKHLNFTKELNVTHQYVLVDPARMQQILVNLLSNAVKYTPEGGSIHLTNTEIPCEREGYATYVTTVSDTGIGMSKEFIAHIFDSFARERTTTESRVIGTGLGMSIVKKLIDLMGGTIEVESEIGKGSKITVTYTLKIVDAPENYGISRDKYTSPVDLKNCRVLLAEDNELNAEIAMAILNEAGVMVECAADGVECVDMLAKSESGYFDFILMDIQMPNLDGYEATKKIRALSDTKKANVPIIAMTANAFDEDKKRAFDVGMNAHIAKPIDVEALLETLGSLLK